MTEHNEIARAARPETYDPVAKTLHWLMAAGILFMIGYGLYIVRQPPSMRTFRLFEVHKSVGMTLGLLAFLRLGWRMRRGAPGPIAGNSARWELALAHVVHVALYAAMIAVPIVGWIGASASGLPMNYFGLFPIPAAVAPSEALQTVMLGLHGWLNYALIALLVLHVAGALKRHVLLRDDTLRRMLPLSRLPSDQSTKDT